VKWGDIGGRFEYGSTPNLRLLYGTWNFMKDAQILVGQDYTPFFYLPSGMCGPGGGECNGIGLGSIYGGRVPQLKLVYSGFQFALLSPSSSVNPVLPNLAFVSVPGAPPPVATTPFAATIPAVRDNDQTIPKIEAAWNGNIGPVGLFIGGQYNQYKVEFQDPVLATNKADVTVSSWAIGAGGKFAMGPFWVAAAGVYSKNPANGGQLISLIPTVMLYDSVTKKSEDATWWSGQGIVGFKMSDMMSFEGGIVYQNGKVKSPVATAALIFPDIEETSINWYVQAVISPAKNFYIVPEVGSINFGDLKVTSFADRKMGDIFWFGVKWQINF
jgi:hypothetical protein